MPLLPFLFFFFFFNDTATTEIYTLSLHDALPISTRMRGSPDPIRSTCPSGPTSPAAIPNVTSLGRPAFGIRSEEHTSELQSLAYLVCRLLLEKKKNQILASRESDSKQVITSALTD